MKKYEIILLDADNTLFDYHKAEKTALALLLTELGIYKPDEMEFEPFLSIYKTINSLVWTLFEKGSITAQQLKTERFKMLGIHLEIMWDENQASDVYLKHLSEMDFLLPHALSVCQWLSKRYKLAILTNGLSAVQKRRYEKSPLKDLIPHIVISEDTGYRKPMPEIFDYTLSHWQGCKKESILMVGDGIGSDILGGMNYGIDTCLVGDVIIPTYIKPTYVIKDIGALPEILDNINRGE